MPQTNEYPRFRYVMYRKEILKLIDYIVRETPKDHPLQALIGRWEMGQLVSEGYGEIVETSKQNVDLIREHYCGPATIWQEALFEEGGYWKPHGAYPSELMDYYYPKEEIAAPTDPILIRANKLINGDRRQDYGHPSKNFSDVAKMWSVILNKEIDPRQVALCMIALKSCRVANSLDHADTWLDIAGYVGCVELIEQGEPK